MRSKGNPRVSLSNVIKRCVRRQLGNTDDVLPMPPRVIAEEILSDEPQQKRTRVNEEDNILENIESNSEDEFDQTMVQSTSNEVARSAQLGLTLPTSGDLVFRQPVVERQWKVNEEVIKILNRSLRICQDSAASTAVRIIQLEALIYQALSKVVDRQEVLLIGNNTSWKVVAAMEKQQQMDGLSVQKRKALSQAVRSVQAEERARTRAARIGQKRSGTDSVTPVEPLATSRTIVQIPVQGNLDLPGQFPSLGMNEQLITDSDEYTIDVIINLLMRTNPKFCNVGFIQCMFNSVAPSTLRQYMSVYRKLFDFLTANSGYSLMDGHGVVDFVMHIVNESKSNPVFTVSMSAVRWLYKLLNIKDPTLSPSFSLFSRGIQRSLGAKVVRKQPITPKILKELAELLKNRVFVDRRDLTLYLLCMSGLLRASEALQIRHSELSLDSSGKHIEINIVSSKTDRFRKGAMVYIGATKNLICPVAALTIFLEIYSQFGFERCDPLFPGMVKNRQGLYVPSKKHLTYSGFRKRLLFHLSMLGYDSSLFGTHSLRAGGATVAADCGISERLIMCHGRWKTNESMDGYIADSLDTRLCVSKSICEM